MEPLCEEAAVDTEQRRVLSPEVSAVPVCMCASQWIISDKVIRPPIHVLLGAFSGLTSPVTARLPASCPFRRVVNAAVSVAAKRNSFLNTSQIPLIRSTLHCLAAFQQTLRGTTREAKLVHTSPITFIPHSIFMGSPKCICPQKVRDLKKFVLPRLRISCPILEGLDLISP